MGKMQFATPVRYREAHASDLPQMALIWSREGSEGGASEQRMTGYFNGQHHPKHALLPRVIYVAQQGDALIGYIAGHLTRRYECEGELQWVYVIPECRGGGVGSELLHRLAAWFREQQASRVCVNVVPDNAPALRFYFRWGAEALNQHWLVWNDIAKLPADGQAS